MDKYLDPGTGRVCVMTGRRSLHHIEVRGLIESTRVDGYDEIESSERWWVRLGVLETITEDEPA